MQQAEYKEDGHGQQDNIYQHRLEDSNLIINEEEIDSSSPILSCITHSDDQSISPLSSPLDHSNNAFQNGQECPTQPSSRRTRTILTPYQSRVLKRVLDQTLFPSTELRNSLATMLNIRPRTIQIWFQNQRQKAKMRYGLSGSIVPTQSLHSPPVIATKSPTGDVRWVQFHGAVRNATPGYLPIHHVNTEHPTLIMHPDQAGQVTNATVMVSPHIPSGVYMHPSLPQPNHYRTHSAYTATPNTPTEGDGLDILASIASYTTATNSFPSVGRPRSSEIAISGKKLVTMHKSEVAKTHNNKPDN